MFNVVGLILISINLILNILFVFLFLAISKALVKLLAQNDREIVENKNDGGLVDIETPQTTYDPRFRNRN